MKINVAACPVECSTCKEGAAWDGGKTLSSSGQCEYYCSKWGFCGEGEKYQKDPSAVCYSCAASYGNNLLSKTIFLVFNFSTQKTFIPTNIFEFILGNSWYYNSANSPYRAYSGLSYEKQQFKVASTPKYDDFNDYY